MRALIKLGGALLESGEDLNALSRELAHIARHSQLVIVHGGGKEVTRYLEQQGIASQFVDGLRVSDAPVVDAVTKVIAGGVNKRVVSALLAAGACPVGLSGVDGGLTTATQLDPQLGFVGRVAGTDDRLLELLSGAGYLPVIACIAASSEGEIFNVNADQMAIACAVAWRAERLLFLTDVPGLKNAANDVIATLSDNEICELIDAPFVKGGMRAKLDAASRGLRHGIGEITIASGRDRNVCTRWFAGDRLGTRLTARIPRTVPA